MRHFTLFLSILFVAFANANNITVTGSITANTTWVNTNIYMLSGEVYVKGCTLTIQEGTIIQGIKSSTRPCLVITKGAKISAIGTPTMPIVFTSDQAPGDRNSGDWGGIIVLGNAPINDPTGTKFIEGIPSSADIAYGGTDPNDNSGTMKYCRIEFGGIAFAPNQEINGLTFGGVGKGTTIENIQVSYAGDDSYEWFGGNVNAKNLVAYYGLDDDFDTDFGFSGNVQFGVSFRHPNIADISGSNGFESDNDATGTFNTPRTKANFSNMTLVGPKATSSTVVSTNYKRAAHIRRASLTSVFNSVEIGWPIGLFLDGGAVKTAANLDSLFYNHSFIGGCNTPLITQAGGAIDSTNGMNTWFTAHATGSSINALASDVLLSNPFDSITPNAMPLTGSPVLISADFTNPRLVGMEKVSHSGAFGTTNWMDQWTSFTPKTNVYKAKSAISNLSFSTTIFPNPTNGVLNLSAGQSFSGTVKVMQMNGSIVSSTEVKNQNFVSIDISNMTEGMYILQVSTNEGSMTEKVFLTK